MQAQYEKLGMTVDVFEPDVRELFEKYPDVAQHPTSWEPELDLAIPTTDICTYKQWLESGYADKLNYKGCPNVIGSLKGTGEEMLGEPMRVGAMSACDARHSGNRGGMPCLVCGPGTGPAHAANEYIDIDVYLDYIKLLTLTVYRWCN